ncbi:MAG: 1-acyl-sn-glycerol-3-phosphate acyltransferase [Proteobacteria bacterium]|nr:1-acyl-sn-glycerol-3-phosphate acyltransferase [Cystobacterineae bacterium]MCL2259510.1 1-acyl-sn-glycerol-3-phosphate acyltransferase [Cystobacterineae bacterium]MCL2314040.1 1-acyl-sn-glycerol-3-phosphate acyltransferase [Pseudomonadota bacterium]
MELTVTLLRGIPAALLTGFFSTLILLISVTFGCKAADPVVFHWCWWVLRCAGLKTKAVGLEKMPKTGFVLAANHQSYLDPMVLFHHIRQHIRYLVKWELRKIPIFGQAVVWGGNICVRRDKKSDQGAIEEAAKRIHQGTNIVFFAEGSRSADGRLKPFKKGAARVAIVAQVPIVPVAMVGVRDAWPRDKLRIRKAKATLVVGEPISTEGLTLGDSESLTARVQAAVAQLLEEGGTLLEKWKQKC